MSSPIGFECDAMECMRMAERAQGDADRAILVDLARAWLLLGEQLKNLGEENNSDLAMRVN